MTDDALLADICEHPEDDVPRLVYADWLEDHGQPERAEFIRTQCELAKLPQDDPRRPALLKRERQLLRAHRADWEAGRPTFAGRGEFVRGFLVPRLKEAFSSFLERRAQDFGPFPIWHVTLTGLGKPRLPDKSACIARLADCPNLLRAAGLNLTANAIGPAGAATFAGCPHLGHVTALSLRRNWVRADGMRALAESASWPRVTDLDLGGNWMDEEGAASLARAPFLASVTELDLSFNWLRDRAAEALAASPHLGRLRHLVLSENFVGDRGARALAGAPWARGLRALTLANQLGDAGARALARSPLLAGIERLDVSDNHRLTAAGCRALRERFGDRVVLPYRHRGVKA